MEGRGEGRSQALVNPYVSHRPPKNRAMNVCVWVGVCLPPQGGPVLANPLPQRHRHTRAGREPVVSVGFEEQGAGYLLMCCH